jgi:ribonuclease HI
MPGPRPKTFTGTPDIENITVFTDASFCSNTKAGGGAFWARWGKTDADKASGAFGIRGAKQSHEAEVIAACNAILQLADNEAANKLLALGRKTRLVLVVDCLTVKQVLEGADTPLCAEARQLVDKVKALRDRLRFWLKVNHVKAHNGQDSPRKWVNHWCDTQARRQMVAIRDTA